MKFINEPIAVDARKGVPSRLRWRRRTYRARRLLDYWILQTRWWGREEKRVYFRLEMDAGVMEVYRVSESVGASRVGFGPGAGALRSLSPALRPPLPMEGDTHTRERRRTDAAYRPDVRLAVEARRKVPDRAPLLRVRWILSKIVD